MVELIEYIAKSLVSKPEDVKVTSETEEDRILLKQEEWLRQCELY